MTNHVFEVRSIGDPFAFLGERAETVMTVREILQDPVFHVKVEGCRYDLGAEVISYRMATVHRGDTVRWNKVLPPGHIDTLFRMDPATLDMDTVFQVTDSLQIIHETSGNVLTDGHLDLIRSLESGDQVIFSRITARGGLLCPRRLHDLILTIE